MSKMHQKASSLYVHIPFCKKKCFYCSFAVVVGFDNKIDDYLHCLQKEAKKCRGEAVGSVYVGGGTPSVLNVFQLEKLFCIIKENFVFDKNAEFTVEVNPESLDKNKLVVMKDAGVNRISLGVQSLNDDNLKYLGRLHDRQKALEAYQLIKAVGFKNISVDLMYAFDKQVKENIVSDVREMIMLESAHLSLYTLSVEKNSSFFVKKIKEQNDLAQAKHYCLVLEELEQAGFHQYEVSNFALAGMESKHNIHYWSGGNYIGLGLGAHSHQNGKRMWNVSRFQEYVKRLRVGQDVVEGQELLTKEERLMEMFLFGLRMNRGVDIKGIEKEVDCLFPEEKYEMIERFVDQGFFVKEAGRVRTTMKGRLVLDEICSRLI